jgi:hypothetical protein
LKRLSEPLVLDGHEIPVSASLGIAVRPPSEGIRTSRPPHAWRWRGTSAAPWSTTSSFCTTSRWWTSLFERFAGGDLDFQEAVGCERCGGVGYRGRVGVYEMMIVGEEISDLILRRASADEVRRAAEEGGMIPLRQDGLLKAAQGETTIEEVLRTVV